MTTTRWKANFMRALVLAAAACMLVTPPARGQEMTPPPEFLVTQRSAYDFDETLSRIRRAIEAENLMVVHEINPQQMLRMVGVRTGGMRQVLFFHPRYMKQIMETNRNAGIEPPLKVLVMESPNGVMVRYEDPVHQFQAYPGLGALSEELRGIFERVVAAVAK